MKFYRIFMLAILAVSLVSCSDSNEDEKSSVKQITEFAVGDSKAVIDQSTKTVTLSLPQGSDITKVKPIIKLSDKATVVPASGEEVDLTNPVKYTVTAENGSKQEFTVTATVAKSSDKKILEFAIGDSKAEINESAKTITLSLPSGTDVTKLKPTLNISPNSTVVPASGEEVNFTNSVKYTVTAQDGTKQEYSVTVTTKASTAKQILSFAVGTSTAQIDETAKTITLELPSGTDITKLKPVVTVSSKATVVPGSGEETNFTNPVKYTVTAEDASKQEYTVTITVAATEKVYLVNRITESVANNMERTVYAFEYDDLNRLVYAANVDYSDNISGEKDIVKITYGSDGKVNKIVKLTAEGSVEKDVRIYTVTYPDAKTIHLTIQKTATFSSSDIITLDNAGRPVTYSEEGNYVVNYEYDDTNGNLLRYYDQEDSTTLTYDSKNSVFKDVNASQWIITCILEMESWGGANNPLSVTESNYRITNSYVYNAQNYPISLISTGSEGVDNYSFYYTTKDKE